MKVEGYCEGCPIVTSIESAIRLDNPGIDDAIIEAQTEDMVRNFGQHLLVLCEAKSGYGIDLRENTACKRVNNKDGNMV